MYYSPVIEMYWIIIMWLVQGRFYLTILEIYLKAFTLENFIYNYLTYAIYSVCTLWLWMLPLPLSFGVCVRIVLRLPSISAKIKLLSWNTSCSNFAKLLLLHLISERNFFFCLQDIAKVYKESCEFFKPLSLEFTHQSASDK